MMKASKPQDEFIIEVRWGYEDAEPEEFFFSTWAEMDAFAGGAAAAIGPDSFEILREDKPAETSTDVAIKAARAVVDNARWRANLYGYDFGEEDPLLKNLSEILDTLPRGEEEDAK